MTLPHIITAIVELDDHTFAWMLYARPANRPLTPTVDPDDTPIALSPPYNTLTEALAAYNLAFACIQHRISPSSPPPSSQLSLPLQALVASLHCPN